MFVTDRVADRAGLWTMPCGDTQSGFTQFFEGENASGIITSGGAEVSGIVSSVAFRGTGADEKMYAFVKTSSGKYAINIYNIGNAVGKTYTIKWIYLDADGKPTANTSTDTSTGEPAA